MPMMSYSTRARSTPSPCDEPPPCAVCGGLNCLCRPRFFAGQILSEDDLNRLETYFIDKNKLHNRYLHGWGVVCGMEVVCSPCGDRVTVQPGYAISPCGDDIIVCAPDAAAVCDLIARCRPEDRPDPNCPPLAHGAAGDCADAVGEWVLAICYDEKASRGITALRGSSGASCCAKCACGGSGDCGCGCHGNGHSHAKNGKDSCSCKGGRTPRPTPPQCEPTQICEGYKFIVYKEEKQSDDFGIRGGMPRGDLVERILNCFRCLLKGRPARPPAGANVPQLKKYCCDFKRWLSDALKKYPPTSCEVFDILAQIKCPEPQPNAPPGDYTKQLDQVINKMSPIIGELFRHCLCSALLPPCPDPVECNCVPLATLSVRERDCKVLSICNWGPRRFVATFPQLIYWLEWTGIFAALRRGIEALCCDPIEELNVKMTMAPAGAAPAPAAAVWPSDVTPFAAMMSEMWNNTGRDINAATLAFAMLDATDPAGKPLASKMEMDNPGEFLVVNEMLRPMIEKTFPPELTRFMAGLTKAPAQSAQEIVELRQAIDELQKTVKEQSQQIEALQHQV